MPTVAAKRKNYQRSINSFMVLTAMILIATCVYGYLRYTKLLEVQNALASESAKYKELTNDEVKANKSFDALNQNYQSEFSEINTALAEIYPDEERYTKVTQDLDAFVNKLNKSDNKIFMSDLRFSKPQEEAGKEYAVLPFTLTLSTTASNFNSFLKLIENSGDFSDKTRLMGIKSISINFENDDQNEGGSNVNTTSADKLMMNVSLSLFAYFQKGSNLVK